MSARTLRVLLVAAAFLFGLPFTNYILSDLGFDNRAASGIAI